MESFEHASDSRIAVQEWTVLMILDMSVLFVISSSTLSVHINLQVSSRYADALYHASVLVCYH